MRIFGVLLIVVLLSAALMLYLSSRDATESIDAVHNVADALRESGVEGQAVDRQVARRVVRELRALVESPQLVASNMEGLREITRRAAAWAEAAATPSAELRLALCIRIAADELRSYGTTPSAQALQRAARNLDEAEAVLAGQYTPGGPADAMRDRLKNLEQSHRENYQALEELGN